MRLFLILFISLHLTSCEEKIIITDDIKTFTKFPKEVKIELKKLVKYKFGNIRQIIATDSTLIIKNHDHHGGKNYNLRNYSLRTSKFSTPYLRRVKAQKKL